MKRVDVPVLPKPFTQTQLAQLISPQMLSSTNLHGACVIGPAFSSCTPQKAYETGNLCVRPAGANTVA